MNQNLNSFLHKMLRELGHALGMKSTLVTLDSTALADKRKSAVKNEM